jgi:hypothetical protein
MVKRHLANKLEYPDRPVTYAIPYDGNESLRPETQAMLNIFMMGRPKKLGGISGWFQTPLQRHVRDDLSSAW